VPAESECQSGKLMRPCLDGKICFEICSLLEPSKNYTTNNICPIMLKFIVYESY